MPSPHATFHPLLLGPLALPQISLRRTGTVNCLGQSLGDDQRPERETCSWSTGLVRVREKGISTKPGWGDGAAKGKWGVGRQGLRWEARGQNRLKGSLGSFPAPAPELQLQKLQRRGGTKFSSVVQGYRCLRSLGSTQLWIWELTKLPGADPGRCTPDAGTSSALLGAGSGGQV